MSASGDARLPRGQLFSIAFCVFCDAVNLTIAFPFIIFMTMSLLNLKTNDPSLNAYAGLMAGAYPIGQLFAGVIIGRLSDKFRTRRLFIVIGLISNIVV